MSQASTGYTRPGPVPNHGATPLRSVLTAANGKSEPEFTGSGVLDAVDELTAKISQANSIVWCLRIAMSEAKPAEDILEGCIWALSDMLEAANAAAGVVASAKFTDTAR